MKIGIVDYDLWAKPKKELNVELMKLGTYYENKGHQVESVTPTDDIFNYDKIIFAANTVIPTRTEKKNFVKHPNIDFIGLSFTNEEYIPFDNEEIDYAEPQFKFYNNLFKYYYKQGIYSSEYIKKMKEKQYARLFPNKKVINVDKILKGEKIYLVDTYIFDKPNWEETIKYISVFNKYFSFLYPQVIKNIDDLYKFLQLKKTGFVNLHAIIKIENFLEFMIFVKQANQYLKETPYFFKWEIGYKADGNYSEQFYAKDFYYSLLKTNFLYTRGIPIIDTIYNSHTDFIFTDKMFYTLKRWMKRTECTKYSFNEYVFLRIKENDIKQTYLSLLRKHPKYKSLVDIIYEKGGVYAR